MSNRIEVDLNGWVLVEFEAWISETTGQGSPIKWTEPDPGRCVSGERQQVVSLVLEGDDVQVDDARLRLTRYWGVERILLKVRIRNKWPVDKLTLDTRQFPFARAEITPTAETAALRGGGLGISRHLTFHRSA